MRKQTIRFTLSSISTLLLFVLLSVQLGPVPPLGPLMNPSTGFWANAAIDEAAGMELDIDNEALSDSVRIYYDEHLIPHIFAQNDTDLYFAQGYVTARDRLFQMDLQTLAAAGRLSEVLGSRTLGYDRYQRRIGMVHAAEQALMGMLEDEESTRAVQAYTAGVNAWIDQLKTSEYPVEYKILDSEPREWTPLRTALLFKYMTYTLASGNNDVRMSNTRAYFGDEFIDQILDLDPALNDPTIPPGTEWNFDPMKPEKPKGDFTPSITEELNAFQANPNNGSNNWAVSGSKTASGYPILANDPHLNMSLPAIWYAVQLHSPNQNVMGVSLPGSPAVIIGFNEHIAWGTTNVSADVWDWYEIEFRDSTLSEYRYDGEWRSTEKRVERIEVKGGDTVVDTVTYTHHGPVVKTPGDDFMPSSFPVHHAIRWIAYEQSNELKYFFSINKARDYEEYREALRYFDSPAQNWIFADSSDIAITVTGKYPLKWEEQGRYISDGSDPLYDWQGWIPFEQIPHVKNPDRGFVSSANQDPASDSYPYYLDDDFAPYERGRRINERLAAMDSITVADMQQLQLDSFSYHAYTVLPKLLEHLRSDTLTGWRKESYELLAGWSHVNEGNGIAPSVFDAWWDALYEAIWDDEYESAEIPLDWPARDQTAALVLNNPELKWYDDITTPETETLDELINSSFHNGLAELKERYGSFGESWKWGYVNDTDINHVGQIPGLGRYNLFTDGGGESVNAIRGNHGPSWRMVVELGPEIKAYGIYPGGQSGNPASRYYDNMIDDWNAGQLYPLRFMRSEPAADSVAYSIILK